MQAHRSLLECRDAQDAKRDIQVSLSPSLITTAYYAPVALRSMLDSTKRRRFQHRPQNGLTACRMSLQIFSAGYGKNTPPPLRKSARTYAYRGLPAFASLSLAGSDCAYAGSRNGRKSPLTPVSGIENA